MDTRVKPEYDKNMKTLFDYRNPAELAVPDLTEAEAKVELARLATEIAGHDAEMTGHALPKYAVDALP